MENLLSMSNDKLLSFYGQQCANLAIARTMGTKDEEDIADGQRAAAKEILLHRLSGLI